MLTHSQGLMEKLYVFNKNIDHCGQFIIVLNFFSLSKEVVGHVPIKFKYVVHI